MALQYDVKALHHDGMALQYYVKALQPGIGALRFDRAALQCECRHCNTGERHCSVNFDTATGIKALQREF